MSKSSSPLQGFNNNVKHRGQIFHIQTEDSGVRHPHVITHLFADGGRIVRSKKTDYSEHIDRPDMAQVLRKLMKEQHKAMFISLRSGEFDHLIEDLVGPPGAPGESEKQIPVAPPAPPPEEEVPQPRRSAPSLHPGQQIDFDSIERAAAEAAAKHAQAPSPTPPAVRGTPVHGTPALDAQAPAPSRPRSGRYAAARPAAIFEAEEGSLFGPGVISEKSLDEVILSYLSEDLEPQE